MLAYRALRYTIRVLLGTFFREVRKVGHEDLPRPEDGPVLLVGNHPNSLIDPALLIATSGRIVHFAAQDGLFRNRAMRWVLAGLGAVPVRRRSDHGGGKVDNAEAFAALHSVLQAGRAIGIFPEGLSHDEAALQRFKTGVARIALGFAQAHPDVPLRIVPCGLTYVRRRRFRSRVLVQYGLPLSVDEAWRARYDDDAKLAVRELTDTVEQSLRDLTVNADDWESMRVLEAVRRLYQPPRASLTERVELARRFCSVYPQVRDEPEVKALWDRVRSYQDDLELAGLTDRDLISRPTRLELLHRGLANTLLILLWLPLAGPGLLLHLPLGLLITWGGRRFMPREDALATSKLLVGALLLVPCYCALFLAAAWAWHWGAALIVGVLLLASGHATLKVLERWHALMRVARRGLRWRRGRWRLEAMRAERLTLVEAVEKAVDQFAPEDMELLFPRG